MIQRGEERTNSILVPISKLSLMSFCTKGLPGVAESTVSLSEIQPSPWEKLPARADEGWGKMVFPGHLPSSAIVPSLPKGGGYFLVDGFCDFAFGFAQNDRGEGRHTAKSESSWTRESNPKEICCYKHGFFNDGLCIG